MGISGLLPALKCIQATRHLSEYAGKTIAVDAYVWLHRGVYTCATELALGKSTHKYVTYAMHRVRLLRHHGIEPYIVFDGGLLPAKQGTEDGRQRKREESLARGKVLMAQGKQNEARDCFLKCVDVTPEHAYQFVKALRAASVRYVVAPYEADAQLAYLERTGLVDGILTEDSDLLVFGCQNVLFKLDATAATVVSISRENFGSVTASASDSNSISLIGWSDEQFRHMAILSGCDYLPSISGIGLKTANTLLRKWKSPEQVIRAIAMEGKKKIPPGYLQRFREAEKCFLHQRVYCPLQERLVHLRDVDPEEWNENFDAYVGLDIDPNIARQIANGDIDPISKEKIVDINPSYLHRISKSPVKPLRIPHHTQKGKAKMNEGKPPTNGILSFFGPNPIIPPQPKTRSARTSTPNQTGKASGKRTLGELVPQDLDKKYTEQQRSATPPHPSSSKFFSSSHNTNTVPIIRRHSDGIVGIAGPSRTAFADKENTSITADEGSDLDNSELSLCARDTDADLDLDVDEFPDVVEQEDGYISATPSVSKDADDLSSPVRPFRSPARKKQRRSSKAEDEGVGDDPRFDVDAVSSPISAVKRRSPFADRNMRSFGTPTRRHPSSTLEGYQGRVLVQSTPEHGHDVALDDAPHIPSPALYRGPDLRSVLNDDGGCKLVLGSGSFKAKPPVAPKPTVVINLEDEDDGADVEADSDDVRMRAMNAREQAVAEGWKAKWALSSSATTSKGQVQLKVKGFCVATTPGRNPTKVNKAQNLWRSETNVTPDGKFKLSSSTSSAPPGRKKIAQGAGLGPRRSLVFQKHTNFSGKEVIDLSIEDSEVFGVGMKDGWRWKPS